jgi:peptidoglycan lytic transglycosylase
LVDQEMQAMTRILAVVMVLCTALCVPAVADEAKQLSAAMMHMRNGDWDQAQKSAGKNGTIARDIIEWHRLRAGRGSPDEVMSFLKRHPDWPGLAWLRKKSETAFDGASTSQILAFFEDNPPQSPEGVLTEAKALIETGRKGEAEANLVLAWRTMPMGSAIQADYVKYYRKLLAPHHEARLDRLLWDGHMVSSKRMFNLVDDGHRALAQARIALIERAPGVDTLIAAVPTSLKDSPGLAHDRFVWRDRKGLDASAIDLLMERSTSLAELGEPIKWARRRASLARQTMRAGDPERAYHIAASHFLTEGSAYADLEWLAGFMALRRLNDPSTALRHFQHFDAAIASPISKGRAGYWLGRAHEALGNKDEAAKAYTDGARYQTSFYGLLAAERAGLPFDPVLANPPEPPSWRKAAFMNSSVLQAANVMLDAGEPNLAERFLTHLVEDLPPEQGAQLGAMALSRDRPHLAVMIAKRAARQAVVLHEAYYPVHAVGNMRLPMAPEMVLSIARRESEFDPVVISGAGARGLMQVMPATAKLVAKDLGILGQHSTQRLTSEWRYNAKLGSNYLAGLAGKFDGNVVMMAAGYNAGPGRPIRWMTDFGDPRTGDIDVIDWIEYIPFNETRNYVMRVTESLPVYRARTGQDPLPIPFSKELVGSTLRSFAP